MSLRVARNMLDAKEHTVGLLKVYWIRSEEGLGKTESPTLAKSDRLGHLREIRIQRDSLALRTIQCRPNS